MADPLPAPPVAAPAGTSTAKPRGRIVAVVGAKGGVGTTSLAVNLAAEAARTHQTVVVDADFGKGDVAGYLDLQPELNVSQLLERIAMVDRDMLLGHAMRHDSGLYVLAQPYDLTDLAPPEPAGLRRLLGQSALAYDIVVVDLGSQVDLIGVAGAAEADVMLLVAAPKVPDLRDARRTLALWHGLGAGPRRICLVLNQTGHRHAIPPSDVARLLGVEVFATVVRDPDAFAAAAQDGRLLREARPRAPGTRAIASLWTAVLEALSSLEGS